ncbi:hypothetical protein KY290_018786 [Solanum tuberosum]|uniref:Uncharacterized protein n=1 Tax=Solanum tuberosum TaxID=4113 RepID=A0ABQ7VHB0_SOLTU|nr:hypothetical protein KY290_018786 [Solanum tuberosum]
MHTNNFSILIQHNGRWDSSGHYVNFNIKGVMYDPTTKYGLITAISSQLRVDTTIYHLKLKYFVSGPSPPMKIHNDMGVQVYLDQKRCNSDFFFKISFMCETCVDRAMESIE